MHLLFAFLCLVLPPSPRTALPPRASVTGRAQTFFLVTHLKANSGPFDVLYFYDDSTFVALLSSGVLARGDSVYLYPELGYNLFRGRVRCGPRADCLSYSLLKRSPLRLIGEVLPNQQPAVPCRSTPAGALVLAGATFRPVPSTRLTAGLRQYLLRRVGRLDGTQYRFDCR